MQADEEITVELEAQWKASVRIARAPNGWYAFTTSYAYALGGGSSPISVWNGTAHTTRDEALEAGIRELKRTYQRLLDWQGWAPATQKTNAARMIELLDQYLMQSRQMSLF
jgi:DnaJ-domain-containing protein 1